MGFTKKCVHYDCSNIIEQIYVEKHSSLNDVCSKRCLVRYLIHWGCRTYVNRDGNRVYMPKVVWLR